MKVKNEYVQIEHGNKVYTKRNMILNKYINKIFQSQINPSFINPPEINSCYLKLDKPLENLDYDSNLTFYDFDLRLYSNDATFLEDEKIFNQYSTKTKNSVSVRYKFTSDGTFTYQNLWFGYENTFNMFSGRKVTAIGFGYNEECWAVVDVSDMNIIINRDEEFVITRVDTYESDGICKGFDYPLHLVNFSAKYNSRIINGVEKCTIAQLYSIGTGNIMGIIVDETPIASLSEVEDNNITIHYRTHIIVGVYPSETLFPSNNLFPESDNSKYIILRYKLYEIDSITNQKTDLNKDYTMNIEKDLSMYDKQNINISFKLKIERL